MNARSISRCLTFIFMTLVMVPTVFSQKQVVLKFNGQNILERKGQSLDSIQVKNLTRSFDTTLIGTQQLILSIITDVDGVDPFVPEGLVLSANFSNPFSEATSFHVTMTEAVAVTLEVHDIRGYRIISKTMSIAKGMHRFRFDGNRLDAGVYFITARIGAKQYSSKVLKSGRSGTANPRLVYEGPVSGGTARVVGFRKAGVIGDDFRFVGFAKDFYPDTITANVTGDATYGFRLRLLQTASIFRITSPGEGDRVHMGANCVVKTVNTRGDSVAIELSTNGGLNWKEILPLEAESLTWFVDNGPFGDCMLRMHNSTKDLWFVTGSFSITDSSLMDYFPISVGRTFRYLRHTFTDRMPGGRIYDDSLRREITILDSTVTIDKIVYRCRIDDLPMDTSFHATTRYDSIMQSRHGIQKITAYFEPFNRVPLSALMDSGVTALTYIYPERPQGYYEQYSWETRKNIGIWMWHYRQKLGMYSYHEQIWTYLP